MVDSDLKLKLRPMHVIEYDDNLMSGHLTHDECTVLAHSHD